MNEPQRANERKAWFVVAMLNELAAQALHSCGEVGSPAGAWSVVAEPADVKALKTHYTRCQLYDDSRLITSLAGGLRALPLTRPVPASLILLFGSECRRNPRSLGRNGLTRTTESRFTILDDLLILPPDVDACRSPEEWTAVAATAKVSRIAQGAPQDPSDPFRKPRLTQVYGRSEDRLVQVKQHGIVYVFDPFRCMFSKGNHHEKERLLNVIGGSPEEIWDMFAGIGYWSLPLARKGHHVVASEWNPDAILALKAGCRANGVTIDIREGDCLEACVQDMDRILCGLIPSSVFAWKTASRALRPEGGWIHVHENVREGNDTRVAQQIRAILSKSGWIPQVARVVRVKSYAPRIWHLVFDVKCVPRAGAQPA